MSQKKESWDSRNVAGIRTRVASEVKGRFEYEARRKMQRFAQKKNDPDPSDEAASVAVLTELSTTRVLFGCARKLTHIPKKESRMYEALNKIYL